MKEQWKIHAACAEAPDPDLWYSHQVEDQETALAICRTCPVATECLNEALADEEGKRPQDAHGIWGGVTSENRWPVIQCRGCGKTPAVTDSARNVEALND